MVASNGSGSAFAATSICDRTHGGKKETSYVAFDVDAGITPAPGCIDTSSSGGEPSAPVTKTAT